ncbi:hypothetical protein [Edaphobacter bradus]|uniref:hypothetical protein n=1 Tax=Edaphobacter bradus TaxID=2259016 RepID=UPI0021DFC2CE|nr:hypothetical protein [Edaphobacter bradus]
MAITFPVEVCLIGAVGSFYLGLRLRKFRVPDIPPKSRAHLSREERQHKIKVAERIAYANAVLMLAGAALISWLAG